MFLTKTSIKCFKKFLLIIYFYTCCFILIDSPRMSVMCMMTSEPGSQVPNSGLCVNESKSCSQQFQIKDSSTENETCMMKYHRSWSSVCESSKFLDGELDEEEKYGKMMLQTYQHREDAFISGAAFNVSFYDIKWEKVYMRFIENMANKPSICREFQVIPAVSSSHTLYFDCLWSNEGLDGKTYQFEYQAFAPTGEFFTYKYLFLVPISDQIDIYKTSLENWMIFTVVDVTLMPEKLELRLQVAPEHLGIKGYNVQVEKTLNDNSKENGLILKEEKLYPKPGEKELRFPFITYSRFGKYIFKVTPIHANCTSRNRCTVSETPPVLIVEMAEPKILTAVVAVVILIPIILMAYFIWKRNCENPREPKNLHYILRRLSLPMSSRSGRLDCNWPRATPSGPPKILLMYSSASVKHVKTVIEIAKYLQRVCGVHALIDELGIPESKTKDPFKWYIEAFNQADYVIIFASPASTAAEREEARKFSRYQDKEQIAQNQLFLRLCSTETKCKFFAVAIPNTDYDTLPVEAAALKRYMFPRDLDPVLMLVGSGCQCDHGAGFLHAIELAAKDEQPVLPAPLNPPPVTEGPPVVAVDDEDDGLASTPNCCNTHSVSELDLVSSRPNFSDDTDDSDHSIDHLGLLDCTNGKVDILSCSGFIKLSSKDKENSKKIKKRN